MCVLEVLNLEYCGVHITDVAGVAISKCPTLKKLNLGWLVTSAYKPLKSGITVSNLDPLLKCPSLKSMLVDPRLRLTLSRYSKLLEFI
ncbi:hypothetical protein ACLB2K_014998 [Fragaria x ananassa]